MTKKEFIDSVHAKADGKGIEITKRDTETVIDSVFNIIAEEVADGERQQIYGFGSFDRSHRKARKGRNPQTGKEIQIPASYSVRFKPAKALKEMVNS